MVCRISLVSALILLCSTNVNAADVVRLEGTKIKAGHEAPQVMYIIPWQSPEGAERLYSPIRGAPIEKLRPLDPHAFNLELDLYQQWKAGQQATVDGTEN